MAVFPELSRPAEATISRTKTKPVIRSKFEGGYSQTRPMCTRSTFTWNITWPVLPLSDVKTIESFFDDNQGDNFTWVSLEDGTSYTVRFVDDSINAKMIDRDQYSVSINIEEV